MGLIFAASPRPADPLRMALHTAYRMDEALAVERILAEAALPSDAVDRITRFAYGFVADARRRHHGKGGIDALLHEYALSTPEGVALMCLAEALLRIPDAGTVDRLIRDKLAPTDWARHLGRSDSLLVNASTWALMLTGRLMSEGEGKSDLTAALRRLLARSGEPVVRQAVTAAIRVLARQFVMGRTVNEALERSRSAEAHGYRHSYDMLGEAARTAADARRYFASYDSAIAAIGATVDGRDIFAAPSISVKLSALHPRYEEAQRERVLRELVPTIKTLARHAKTAGIGLTIDAEEAERLDLSLDLIEALATAPDLVGWNGLGLAVQAYQKRALPLLDWLADLARRSGRRLMVRLVKGAYWDSEIKRSQERGLDGYPVFTRKLATDVSYLACAKKLLALPDFFFPQFATHNAHTLAAILELAGDRNDYEFQRLHGMGEALYEQMVGNDELVHPCRIYAPVGSHEDLLAYLVRRLLENGANTSFVNRLVDEQAPIEELVADPIARLAALSAKSHPHIPLPHDLYRPERPNARSIDLSNPIELTALAEKMSIAAAPAWRAMPIIGGAVHFGPSRPIADPADRRRIIGSVVEATRGQIEEALTHAAAAAADWDATPATERAVCLDRAADLFEVRTPAFMAIIIREGGRTIPDALSEVRETIDYCRYYAARTRTDFGAPMALPGPTGERNILSLHARGVFACIAPWNFPLAIFTGQVAAALAAGNAVIAKPAEQTPLVASAAVRLLHEAGIPAEVLHLLPGDGAIGAQLVADPRIAGIAFTGSTETARAINLALAQRSGPIIPLIAETGGQNALIADSSALPEQVVADILASAFNSAGQRCSALRVLFIQEDIADRVLAMLDGAMQELVIGDPGQLATDVGPLIDEVACAALEHHAERMEREGRRVCQLSLPSSAENGCFSAPRVFEIDTLARLNTEAFGPVLHVIRWRGGELDAVLDQIAATGYGLTLGIHSRVDETVWRIQRRLHVGNIYVNRNMIGAVVGVQPFGGEGLSGTGPKAGGPRYLHRFAVERTLSIDTTASGGNASLLSLGEEDA